MGKHRSLDSYIEEAKVQLSIAKELELSSESIYNTWKGYGNKKLSGEKNIASSLRLEPEIYSPKTIDYFATIGFELFLAEMFKEKKYG